jgi:His-Xaa-Ser system protein HxsD
MLIKFDKDFYSKEAIMKTAFVFTDRAYLHLSQDKSNFIIECWPKKEPSEESSQSLGSEIRNEALAQSLRQLVLLQTKNIRELILARALASTIVGEMKIDDLEDDFEMGDTNLERILTDWFDKNE